MKRRVPKSWKSSKPESPFWTALLIFDVAALAWAVIRHKKVTQ
jgi:hypothetical protein